VALRAFELAEGATARAVVPTLAGGVAATFTARREGEMVTITREDSSTDKTDGTDGTDGG
jgi:hypothetical protein